MRKIVLDVFVVVFLLAGGILFQGNSMNTPAENRLTQEKSPYLKSAAHQPVQWYPWSDEAFKKAQELDRPILLDIGAVWCHWCHVIDRESYENPEIAQIINESFIPIKVDRDERPDVDSRYQLAVGAISGQGGWPLTAFLIPEGDVFYGGTYFPPEDQYGRPGFKTLLRRIASIYKEKREAIHEDAKRLHEALKDHAEKPAEAGHLSAESVQNVLKAMQGAFDGTHGGFGDAPKFPHASALELAVNRAFFTRESWLLEMITKTLEGMALGGVYDQIGGGFHRYSTDERWIVPHFEKMAYDNSELLKNYVHGYQLTGNPLFQEIAYGIMSFVTSTLSDQIHGGFYASQDADINLEDDGDYFTWTRKEVEAVLQPEETRVAMAYYDIGESGEMHHNPEKNVLFVAKDIRQVTQETGLADETVRKMIPIMKRKMLEARAKRPAPFVDRTLYANWNGMMIQAYFEAYKGLGDEAVRTFALKSLRFLIENMWDEKNGFSHAYSEGKPYIPGFLDDQIQMASALISAYEVTGEMPFLDLARKVIDLSIRKFWDPVGGGFFDIEEPLQAIGKLKIRQKSIQDTPNPSANGTAALVLEKLYLLTGDSSYRDKAEITLKAFAAQIPHLGFFAGTYAVALDFHLNGKVKVVVAGEHGKDRQTLTEKALNTFHPYKVVQPLGPKDIQQAHLDPALRSILERQKDHEKARAYVCQGPVCLEPTSDPTQLGQLIANLLAR